MDYTIFSHVPKSFDIYIYLNMFRKREISFHGNQFIIENQTYIFNEENKGCYIWFRKNVSSNICAYLVFNRP